MATVGTPPGRLPPKTDPPNVDHARHEYKTWLLVVSIVPLGIGIIYVSPAFIPAWTEMILPMWDAVHAWLTTPVLFLLMNLVVGTLAVTSGKVKRPKNRNRNSFLWNEDETDEDDDDEDQETKEEAAAAAAKVSKSEKRAHASADKDLRAQSQVKHSRLQSDESPSVSARSEVKLSLSPAPRIVRSKSEKLFPSKNPDVMAHRLRKAGTFESSAHTESTKAARLSSRVVVVEQPPEEEPVPGSEEVDEKAEAFIGKFYQQMKLQRQN